MSFTAAALLELHRLHQQLGDLRDRLERGPKQIRARQANVAQSEDKLAKAQAETKAARIASDQKQLQLKTGEAKIVDLKSKLNACGTNREYQALKDQIAASEMANSVLSDEVLESMEKIDQLKAGIGELEQLLSRTRADLQTTQQAVQAQEESLLAEVRRVEGNLQQAEAALPKDFKDAYDRVVRSKGRDSMAPIDGESCGGCFQQLTPNMINDLMLSRVVFCKVCGRLLYLPENRAPASER
ncbi:MAG: phospholipase [Planctomycetota bacterium]|nr:phospholipase [Planctomycetota bacterium]